MDVVFRNVSKFVYVQRPSSFLSGADSVLRSRVVFHLRLCRMDEDNRRRYPWRRHLLDPGRWKSGVWRID